MSASSAAASRKYIDCSEFPSDSNCTLKISGKEDEVLPVAVPHAATVHGHEDTPLLRDEISGCSKTNSPFAVQGT